MYFNRYLFVRYLSAVFFFIKLYWLIVLFLVQGKTIFIPALLILSIFPAVFEQAKLYSTPQNIATRTMGYFWVQLIVNVGLLLATFTPLFQVLFPFMKQGINDRAFIVAALLIGFFMFMDPAFLAYFAIKFEVVKPMLAQMPWASPVGIGTFVGSGGDLKAAVLAVLCAILAFAIWFPFIKSYDNKLLKEEQDKSKELTS